MFIFHHDILAERNHIFSVFFGLAKGFGALTDIVATLAMCKLLSTAKTDVHQTKSIVKTIMNYIINRGVIVTVIQTLLVITFYASPKRLDWLALHVNVTKLYANTFFAMLNSREHLKRRLPTHVASSSRHSHSKYHVPLAGSFSAHGHDSEAKEDAGVRADGDNAAYPMSPLPTVSQTVVITKD
ncbi:hypothetical protein HGRIS_010390 [Hohenbuehelia grisea]|uniref:DUF6534 domain-containing protein n=1 Tax=Hohenbuehelia grisea TaxID=104357 RepID=A0ABR3J4E5_9AGAR